MSINYTVSAFSNLNLFKFKVNSLPAWTIKTSTDSVRMTLAWAQLIHIILVTSFAGNSLI